MIKKYTLMTILWAFIIFLVTILPAEVKGGGTEGLFDKVIHFGMFFAFGVFLLLMKSEVEIETKKLIYFFLGYALLTEVYQLWVPTRSFSLFDLTSNLLGVISFKLGDGRPLF